MRRKILFVLFLHFTFYILHFIYNPPSVYADPPIPPVAGPVPWDSARCIKDINGVQVATIQGFECLFVNLVRILVPIAGLAMFVMLVVGSFKLITADGEAKQIQQARLAITSAIVGLVLLLGIWFIFKFIQTITGVDVTQFVIPGP